MSSGILTADAPAAVELELFSLRLASRIRHYQGMNPTHSATKQAMALLVTFVAGLPVSKVVSKVLWPAMLRMHLTLHESA